MSSPELTDGYVLCQDCGHVEPYTADRHENRASCSKCNGDFCGCNYCSELARLALVLGTTKESDDVQE